jgi:hypothetical protein
MLRALGYRGTPNQPWLRLAALAVAIVLVLMVSTGAVLATQAVINSIRTQPTTVPTAAPTAMSLTFDGPIQQLAQERWVVGGRTILLDPQTAIRGIPSLGMLARIHGTLGAGGALLADSITIEAPTVLPTATFVPPAPATATPAPPIAPTTTPAPAAPAPQVTAQPPAPQPGDDNHVCQGQQRGRDDKKCDPKPHDNKPPGGKHDDKPKDKGPHK